MNVCIYINMYQYILIVLLRHVPCFVCAPFQNSLIKDLCISYVFVVQLWIFLKNMDSIHMLFFELY